MAAFPLLPFLAGALLPAACLADDEGYLRSSEQSSGCTCTPHTHTCNVCGNLKPTLDIPHSDILDGLVAVANGGLMGLWSDFFNTDKINAADWACIGAAIMDGVQEGGREFEQKAAWNTYHLEKFVSDSTDYVICQVQAIVGEYFHKFMDSQDLCNYNIGINAMADSWLSSCHSRQCLNLTDKPSDHRLDCCSVEAAGNSYDCLRWSDENISKGLGFCRLEHENFPPGTGVCSTDRICKSCMDFPKAIEMTQAQIDSFETSPTNWGEALQGYANVDALVAQARGTMMMLAYYQELILLGAESSIGDFQLFATNAHQQMQGKVDLIMSSTSKINSSSCTLGAPLDAAQLDCCLSNLTVFLHILENYSQRRLPSQVFGAYGRVGYRMPSCDASTASAEVLAECQLDPLLPGGRRLPHSQFHL